MSGLRWTWALVIALSIVTALFMATGGAIEWWLPLGVCAVFLVVGHMAGRFGR